MLRNIWQIFRTAAILLILLMLITGLLYPALITGIGQLLFNKQANGSLMPQGSQLLGQTFSSPRYFWGRPSATSAFTYNTASSSGSNLAPNNPAFIQAVQARVAALHAADPSNHALIPIDLVTASGSGLDPDISPAAAYYQAARIAQVRHLPLATVNQLIQTHITARQFALLGDPHVNVLQLNHDLDILTASAGKSK